MNIFQFGLAVDAVVFGYRKETGLRMLLVKRGIPPFKGQWALPGGFLRPNESPEETVVRELQEETGIKVTHLEQLYTFGNPDRDPRGRIISIAYMALVRPENWETKADTDAEEAHWFPISGLPKLAFDHSQIIETALQRLRAKITYQPIGFDLLTKLFPFSDLENLYQSILNKEFDRRNFKKKLMASGILEETEKIAPQQNAGRPAKLYRFNKQRYKQLQQSGYSFNLEI
jgi:8-oxo-dGTP diphosphatase